MFAYAATDEKENDHYGSRAHLPGAELALLAFACTYCDRQQGRGQKSGLQWINPTGPSDWLYKETPKKDKEDLAKSS